MTLLLLVPSYAGIDALIRPYLDRLCWPRMELKRFAPLHLSRINVSAPQTNAIIPNTGFSKFATPLVTAIFNCTCAIGSKPLNVY